MMTVHQIIQRNVVCQEVTVNVFILSHTNTPIHIRVARYGKKKKKKKWNVKSEISVPNIVILFVIIDQNT